MNNDKKLNRQSLLRKNDLLEWWIETLYFEFSKNTGSLWSHVYGHGFNELLSLFRTRYTGVSPRSLSRVIRLVKERAQRSNTDDITVSPRPPFNAEYLLYLFLRKEERDVVIGDLIECHKAIARRFNKRRADIWFYKQVAGSLFPLLRRAMLRIGALVWLGRVLRRLIS